MRKIAKYLILISGFICMSVFFGCRTLSTRADLPSSGPVDGLLFYYLPIGKITITGKAPPISAPTATPTPTPTATPKTEKEQTEQDDGGLADQTLNVTAKGARTPKKTPKEGEGDQGGPAPPNTIAGGNVTIMLTAEVEADERAGAYYMRPEANYLYEDEVHISSKKHLLSTGNVTTEDKTADIVGAVASLATTIPKSLLTTEEPKPEPFTFSFQPHNANEVATVARELKRRGIYFSVTANGENVTKVGASVHAMSKAEMEKLKELAQLSTERGSPGLLFRPAASYQITLRYTDPRSKSLAIKNTQQFILPDPTKLYVMRYDRMAFVKKVREVGFTDGMLTEFHQKVPSPILGFLGIPKAILQAIVPVPAAPPSGSGSASGTTGQPTN